jgi:hypothetical protein
MKVLGKQKLIRSRIRDLINRPTTAEDLMELAQSLGISIDVGRIQELNSSGRNSSGRKSLKGPYLVLNLDRTGSGNHWIAVDKSKKTYLDSYGFTFNEQRPKELSEYMPQTTSKQIQSLDSQMCGPIAVAWLAAQDREKLIDMFKDVYVG